MAIQSISSEQNSAKEANAGYRSAPPVSAGAGIYVLQRSPEPSPKLSAREREVLYWLALGRSGKNIARTLNIGVCTVRAHIRNIMRKLDAVNIPHAVARAFLDGTLPLNKPAIAPTK